MPDGDKGTNTVADIIRAVGQRSETRGQDLQHSDEGDEILQYDLQWTEDSLDLVTLVLS